MLVYAEAAVAQNLQYAVRMTAVDAARALALCISKGKRLASDSTDKASAQNGATPVAAEDAGTSLSQVKTCLRADDADRGCCANLEGQTVEIHANTQALIINGRGTSAHLSSPDRQDTRRLDRNG